MRRGRGKGGMWMRRGRGRSRMWVRGRDGEGKCGRGKGTEKEYVGEERREEGGVTLKGRE